MNDPINCPVCSYHNITGDNCPNCDTDLRVIRILQGLPLVKKSVWPLKIAALVLIFSLTLGLGLNLIFSFSQLNISTIAEAVPMDIYLQNSSIVIPQTSPESKKYTVKAGDTLSAIAHKLCGENTSWQFLITANPQLQGKENAIDVGEVLKVPDC